MGGGTCRYVAPEVYAYRMWLSYVVTCTCYSAIHFNLVQHDAQKSAAWRVGQRRRCKDRPAMIYCIHCIRYTYTGDTTHTAYHCPWLTHGFDVSRRTGLDSNAWLTETPAAVTPFITFTIVRPTQCIESVVARSVEDGDRRNVLRSPSCCGCGNLLPCFSADELVLWYDSRISWCCSTNVTPRRYG